MIYLLARTVTMNVVLLHRVAEVLLPRQLTNPKLCRKVVKVRKSH